MSAPIPSLDGPIRSVALIGARGGMGRLLTRHLRDQGVEVREVNRPLDPEVLATALAGVDLVYLSVPYPAIDTVLARIVPFLGPGTVLAENCSVKVQPMKHMLGLYSGPVVGTHPLFGPAPAPDTPLRTAVVPGRDQDALRRVLDILESAGQGPFVTTAEEHDRCVALIQGLNFVTTLAYLACAAQDPDIARYLTPSFDRRLEAARKMLLEDAELFTTLFEANPYSQDGVRQFRSLLNLAAAGDLDLLVEKARWWWTGRRRPDEEA